MEGEEGWSALRRSQCMSESEHVFVGRERGRKRVCDGWWVVRPDHLFANQMLRSKEYTGDGKSAPCGSAFALDL